MAADDPVPDDQPNSAEPSVLGIEELLQRPSTLPEVGATLRGFATEEEANELGNIVLFLLRILGTFLDLERLDGVTIAHEYEAALAGVQRGFTATNPATPTRDEFAVGVAMAVMIMRDDQPRSHLVLHAGYMAALKDPQDPNYGLAMHILAHEAAHVHDLAYQDRAFPGVLLKRKVAYREGLLLQMASACWEEYVASRLSASFAADERLDHFESTFCAALQGVRERTNGHIRRYRLHADLTQLMAQVEREYGGVLKYGSYLLGHVAGLGRSFPDTAPTAYALVQSTPHFKPTFEKLSACLESMHANYGNWPGLEVYAPLQAIVHELLKAAGVDIQDHPEGAYIAVPFTPETMPV